MKNIRDIRNLQTFLLVLYLIFAFLFTCAFVAAGFFFQDRNESLTSDALRASGQIAAFRIALADAHAAAEAHAVLRTRESASAVLRSGLELRRIAEHFTPAQYGGPAACREAAVRLEEAANRAGPRPQPASFDAFYPVFTAALADAEAACRRWEELSAARNRDDAYRLQRDFWRLAALLSSFFLFSVLFTFFSFFLLGRSLRRSLRSLSDGTREFRKGNMEYRFRRISPDEIGQVKYDFNIMAHRIARQSSDLRRANHELRDQAEKLIAAHQHKDRFLSNMSHELRTPLSSIIGFSELIGDRAGKLPPEKLKVYSGRILTAAEHLLDLITSLLDLAKSGAGVLKPVPVAFDLVAAVRETASLLIPSAEKKNLAVHFDLPEELTVTADPRMIRQIILNLFGNAVKYTFSGSVSLSLRRQDGSVILCVSDTGIGIPESEHANLFTDFYRVDNGPDIVTDGVGIGLALSRRLAALHHGTITFRSREGEGSAFTLTLPVSDAT